MIMNKSSQYKSKLIALLLWFFLGAFGAHNFYLNNKGAAYTQLILNLIGWSTMFILIGFVPLVIVGIWLLIDLIRILTSDDKNFDWHQ